MPNSLVRKFLVLGAIGVVGFALFRNKAKLCRPDTLNDPAENSKYPGKLLSAGEDAISQVGDTDGTIAKNRHEAQEEDYWFWTKWTAVIAAVGAFIAAIFAAGAFYEALRQADAAVESNRPWLYIKSIEPAEFDVVKDRSISATFELNMKNIGHSVAPKVFAVAQIVPFEGANFERARDFCFAYKISDFEGPGQTAFPEEEISIRFRPEPYPLAFKHDPDVGTQIMGCALYEDGKGETHHTGIIYRFDKVDTSKPRSILGTKIDRDRSAGSYAD